MLIYNGIRLACVAALIWIGACAAELDENGAATNNDALETSGASSSASETRVGIVFALGSNSDNGLPPRPPSIIASLCIDLGKPDAEITGVELLAKAAETHAELGIVMASFPYGSALCKVETFGCPAEDCFCDNTAYWSYWLKDTGTTTWDYASVGMDTRELRPGDMDGWSWLPSSAPIGNPDVALPDLSFDKVCLPQRTVLLPVIIR